MTKRSSLSLYNHENKSNESNDVSGLSINFLINANFLSGSISLRLFCYLTIKNSIICIRYETFAQLNLPLAVLGKDMKNIRENLQIPQFLAYLRAVLYATQSMRYKSNFAVRVSLKTNFSHECEV